MFYDVYCALCEKNGLTPSGAASKIGFNRASVTVWKNTGKAPKQELLLKIADFFGVTTDYLLTGDENKKAPTQEGEREIGFDDFTYAFYEESKDLPDEKKKMLLEMARFMKADIEKEKG
ncbi:helix-turn-helix domain-containing protein [Flavonifractor plautii]|uniref:helix-turn-helix domain-containing protein n=1 Tax=Flavonifractor plautii TaxID=292800 RepID=UPI001FF2AC89|nr:helix-turn-helix transcriptional regulator [Flavonifractor plautii]MCI7152123.1 helix-turn-helix transcriptional regulator [Flavonifractor plautii]MDY3701070.1 helix-turn-helix transcriptional regulator [Flavonifractor plautii]UOX45986.1 helix-turn-helix transcriptional regulator [Flavonifractor plautii]